MTHKNKELSDTPLVPLAEFDEALRTVLRKSKGKIDKKMAEFQASNKALRESKKTS